MLYLRYRIAIFPAGVHNFFVFAQGFSNGQPPINRRFATNCTHR
jgi:hypothetical protein